MTLASYTPTDVNYDYAVGGLPFLSAIGHRLGPYTLADLKRQTAPFRKDQTDQTNEVGEQSLSFWWLRSQSSFHSGAGQKFLDGNGDDSVSRHTRFEHSRAVDVWTPGEASVLPKLTQDVGSIYATHVLQAYQGYLYVDQNTHSVHYRSTLLGTTSSIAYGGTGFIYSLVSDGNNYYVSSDSGVYKGALNPPGPGAKICATTDGPTLAWVKSRLIAGSLNALYVLNENGTPTTPLPTALYTHPNTAWRWNCFSEGPSGIYAGGYVFAGWPSEVYLLSLTVTTGTPQLNAPVSVITLPFGEQLLDIYSYLSKFLVLGTGKGVRIGKIQSDGTVDLGGLTLNGDDVRGPDLTYYHYGVVGHGGYLYCLSGGTSAAYPNTLGLIRVDLSNEIQTGRYAWAADMSTTVLDTGYSITFDLYDNAIIGGDHGTYITSTTPDPLAFLWTSRIRYSTSEPKVFERVRGEATASGNGHVTLLVFDPADNVAATTVNVTPSSSTSGEFRIEDSYTGKVGQYLQVEIDFTESTAHAVPDLRFRSYALKALPAQKRQRVIQVPLQCFDDEKDQSGQRRGEQNTAWSRLKALEALEESGTVVRFQQFGPGFTSSDDMSVVVDDITFVQTGSPNSKDAWGGVALATLRTVD